MQNWVAIFALISWPLVTTVLLRFLPLNTALLWAILAAQLLLPAGASLKLPMIPAFDKASIPNLSALLGLVLIARKSLKFYNGFALTEILIISFTIGPLVTSELNGDLVVLIDAVLPSVGHYDGVSAAISQFITLIPFILGRQFLATPQSNEQALHVLVLGGLFYSVLLLFEIRMSPQLQIWIYGFMPGEFYQEVRGGSFRPVVFMGHGLVAAFFAMTSTVAACTFWRARTAIGRIPAALATTYLFTVLLLCRSFGATLYAIFLMPLVRFASPRAQMRIAVALVSFALTYPALRLADIIPTNAIVNTVSAVSIDRALSLQTRFFQEDRLLQRALQRPLFGWGRFGRSRIYSDNGRDISITDGRWVITIGQFGIVGFLAEFGLLAFPVFRAAASFKYTRSLREQTFLGALSLILAINMVELLPNSTLTPWTWLLAGSLLGRAELLQSAFRRNKIERRAVVAPEPIAAQRPGKIPRTIGKTLNTEEPRTK